APPARGRRLASPGARAARAETVSGSESSPTPPRRRPRACAGERGSRAGSGRRGARRAPVGFDERAKPELEMQPAPHLKPDVAPSREIRVELASERGAIEVGSRSRAR